MCGELIMHAHTPPFTKPEAAYDSRRLYEETSAIAAAQDAKHAMTDAERDAKLRTVAHYIYHAKLLMDEVFGTERAGVPASADIPAKASTADLAPKWTPQWLADNGVPVESSYLASFGPNDDIPTKSPKAHRRVLTDAERKAWGIGDVEPRHPMHAEALRDHDERLFGGEDRL